MYIYGLENESLSYLYQYKGLKKDKGVSLKRVFTNKIIEGEVKKHVVKKKAYSNHLGNVLAVITDRRIQACGAGDVMYYNAQVVSISDYYPFGLEIKERTWRDSSFSYRMGWNGKEKDDEISGEGNTIAFEARIYDSRLGRFLSSDPWEYKYAWQTPYAYFGNSPIAKTDHLGLGDDKERASNPKNRRAKEHTVVKGDNVWKIAASELGDGASNKQIQELSNSIIAANGLNEKGDIQIGQKLLIPGSISGDGSTATNRTVGSCNPYADLDAEATPAKVILTSDNKYEHVESTDALWGAIVNEGQQAYDITYNTVLNLEYDESGAYSYKLDFEVTNLKRTWSSHSLNLTVYTVALTELAAVKVLRAAKVGGAAATTTEGALVSAAPRLTKHAVERFAQRGITEKMVQTAIAKGQKFYDPLNNSINYVLRNGFGSGKSLLVGTNPLTGAITTAIRSSKNLIKSRMIPIR